MNSTITKRYRVLATTTIGFVDPKVDTAVKWEGTDTDELSRAYPPSDIFGADDLFQKEIEDGFIITRFTFERQLADGSWEDVDDPRRRLSPMTDLELEIDAENRRLYPGDYMTACETCGYDDCRCEDYDDRSSYKPDCVECDDNGCAKCDPKNVCKTCNQYCDPQDYPLNEDTGLCKGCEYESSLCTQCQDNQSNGDDHICSNCRSENEWEATPKCNECYHAVVANEGDNCQACQAYLEAQCIFCQRDVADGDDKLCGGCRKYVSEPGKYYVWWRRALRACMFWR